MNRASILLLLPGVLTCTAHAQTQSPSQSQSKGSPNAQVLEEVVVTGTNLRGITAIDGPSPMVAITVDDLQVSGAMTVYEALEKQPFFAGLADNFTRSGAHGQSTVNLRGLGSDFTLVLLNGRRIGVNDLNLVPFAAVQRIDVLKDGASAVYGSDAMAGVVNIVLRDEFDGFEFATSYGNTTEYGDGGRFNASFLTGTSGDHGHLTLSGQYEKHSSILSLESPLGVTDDERVYGGTRDFRGPRRNPGLITLPSGARVMLGTTFGSGETGDSIDDYGAPHDEPIDKQRPSNLQNGREASTLFATGEYELMGEHLVGFANFLYKDTKIDYIDHRGTFLNFTVPAQNFWNPFGTPVQVNYLLNYGTAPGRQERPLEALHSDITTVLVTTGLKGRWGAVDYEVAYSNYDNEDFQSHDGLSRAGLLAQLARTDAGALNLFGNAAVTEEQLLPARARFTRSFHNFVRSFTGVVRFAPFELPAGAVSMAIGGETRDEGLENIRDEALNIFRDAASLPFLNDSSDALSRSIDAYYAELNVPLFGADAAPRGLHKLELGLAVRREEYSDFGSATVPRYTLRWVPLADESLTFRASFSESFRAPELDDLTPQGDVNVNPFSDPLILDAAGNPLIYNIETESGGNPNLDATTGEYLNFGVILRPSPLPGFTASVDVWKLDQEDAFVTPLAQAVINGVSPGVVTRDTNLTPGDVYSGAPVGRIIHVNNRITNAAVRNVAGVDLDLLYTLETGRFGVWSAAWYNTFTTKFEFDQADGLGIQEGLGKWTSANSFGAVPKLRSNLSLTHQLGAFTTNLSVSYFDEVENLADAGTPVESYTRTDLALRYEFDAGGAGLLADSALSINIDNIFDEQLPFVGGLFRTGIVADYSYGDPVGRFVTVGFRKRF
jgi:iron complex outermembrane receptor protein